MPAPTRTTSTSRTVFMRAVSDELTKFERSEREFRKKCRDQRAKRLHLPVEKYDAPGRLLAKPPNPVR
jgi:hypothetical protein